MLHVLRTLKLPAPAQRCNALHAAGLSRVLQFCSEPHVPVRAGLVGVAAVEGLQHSAHETLPMLGRGAAAYPELVNRSHSSRSSRSLCILGLAATLIWQTMWSSHW